MLCCSLTRLPVAGPPLAPGSFSRLSICLSIADLKLVQRWLQWFRRDAEKSQARDIKLYTSLLQEVKEKMQKGTAKECMGTRSLLARDSYAVSDLELAYFVSAPFGPGIDTVSTCSVVMRCLAKPPCRRYRVWKCSCVGTLCRRMFSGSPCAVAAVHFPDAVNKAQVEIDHVVGRDRMPRFEDEDALPYVRAFIKEVERYAHSAQLTAARCAHTH